MSIRIALDTGGSDRGPLEIVKGAVEAARGDGLEVVLVGQGEVVGEELAKYDHKGLELSLVEASQVVDMGESPTQALRAKKDSSLVVGMNLLKSGTVSGLVSAGNTGAIMAAATFILGRSEGVKRPALGVVIHPPSGPVLLLDVGANADCKPSFLVQFAHLGSDYMKTVFGLEHPKVALLSNGEEESKGDHLVREAHKILKGDSLNFVGNVEGGDLAKGLADVIVTDGFTGNVVIKLIEGLNEVYFQLFKEALNSRSHLRAFSFLMRPALRTLAKKLDYAEYGGVPLLGVKGNVIIAHGRSEAKAVRNALRLAHQAALGAVP